VGQGGQGHRHEGGLSATLSLLSAGAAQSVATALARQHGIPLRGEFGAVGAMRQRLLDGAPCDVIILTQAMVRELNVPMADLGKVPTSIAVREADAAPDLSDLKAALQGKDIYFPDPDKATAGVHVRKMLLRMGITSGWKIHPNGATAMREMAKASGNVIGCTQATEILATPGLKLVAPLAGEYALETMYSAGLLRPEGKRFFDLLTGDGSRDLRIQKGFHV
jgi:molybdate transport system substrate-binding protein